MFDNYFTQELKPEEEVIIVIRKHWASIIISFIKVFVIWIILAVLTPLAFQQVMGIFLFFFVLSISLGYVTYHWITWYFDIFIITNLRIIDVDQHTIFRRTVSEVTLENIQDVTYEITGFVSATFNYGIVKVQSASAIPSIQMEYVKDPKQTQELISKLAHDIREKNQVVNAEELIRILQKQQTNNKNTTNAEEKQS
ncbi:MAG: hypothetical protein ABIE68_02580 [bacterium]